MSNLKKLTSVLDLITEQRPLITPEIVCDELGVSLPTAFRYVRELYANGLLTRLSPGQYSLGPRILMWDYRMRRTDQLERVGRELLLELSQLTGMTISVSYLFDDQVVHVYELPAAEAAATLYSRGQRIPWFALAAARIVLAYQKPAVQKRLFEQAAGDPERDLIGVDWGTFRKTLAGIRKEGTCLTRGNQDTTRVGIAAPLLRADRIAFGSLTIVGPQSRISVFDREMLRHRLIEAAEKLAERLGQDGSAAPQAYVTFRKIA